MELDNHVWKGPAHRGSIVRVDYRTTGPEDEYIHKYVNVYVPYGYDADKPYNILYLMHGGGGNPDTWLDSTMVKNVLDQSFDWERCKPFLVAFPSFYLGPSHDHRTNGVNGEWEYAQVMHFMKEFEEDVMPAVESRFHTCAPHATLEGFKASRAHRAFGGFSMGSVTTWEVMMNHLDKVSVFLPISGDVWRFGRFGGSEKCAETVKMMADTVKGFGMTAADFRIYAGTGTEDIAYPNMFPMLEEMKKYPEVFAYDEDVTKGNFHCAFEEGAKHNYWEVYQWVWRYLPYFWG